MPFVTLSGRAAYLPGANNLGIVATGDGGAIAIDTGLDKDTGRAIKKALDTASLRLVAIINTHHHADHVGGNDYLLRAYPAAEVYAPPVEAALIRNPILEPSYLSLGAHPPQALKTKWLMAKGSPVHHLMSDSTLSIADVSFEIVPLPGHSIDQIGVAVDGVCFAADGFFGASVLQKHGIPYAHDIAAQLASLEILATRNEHLFIPGHGELVQRDDLPQQLAANREAIERASRLVHEALATPGSVATVATRVMTTLGNAPAGLPQHAIFVSVIAAHLTYLEQQGLARLVLEEGEARWMAS